jgi:hypothetical protein
MTSVKPILVRYRIGNNDGSEGIPKGVKYITIDYHDNGSVYDIYFAPEGAPTLEELRTMTPEERKKFASEVKKEKKIKNTLKE